MEKNILIRYSEIGIKGKNRPFFENKLVDNIRIALPRNSYRAIQRLHGRIIIEGISETFPCQSLLKVFGIFSLSECLAVPLDLDEIKNYALTLFEEALKKNPVLKSFKVNSRRSNKKFPLTSLELNSEVGDFLKSRFKDISVKMQSPDIEIGIEIGYKKAFIYGEVIKGLGGLPVEVSGKTLLLLSGGIDSPVAGWLTMKRGCKIFCIHYYSFPFTGEKSKEKVIEISKLLGQYQGSIRLFIIPFTEIQQIIRKSCKEEFMVILYRRMMYRIAERVANMIGAKALVTGESIGQVASQTLDNLYCTEKAISKIVLRPLITYDKIETVELAKSIGTYKISILPYEDCCSLFIPRYPKTNATLEEIEEAEKSLDIEEIAKAAIEKREIIDL